MISKAVVQWIQMLKMLSTSWSSKSSNIPLLRIKPKCFVREETRMEINRCNDAVCLKALSLIEIETFKEGRNETYLLSRCQSVNQSIRVCKFLWQEFQCLKLLKFSFERLNLANTNTFQTQRHALKQTKNMASLNQIATASEWIERKMKKNRTTMMMIRLLRSTTMQFLFAFHSCPAEEAFPCGRFFFHVYWINSSIQCAVSPSSVEGRSHKISHLVMCRMMIQTHIMNTHLREGNDFHFTSFCLSVDFERENFHPFDGKVHQPCLEL